MTEDLSIRSTDKTLAGIGGIAGLVPFFFHATTFSTTTVNGQVVEASYRDNVALACGAVALLCGIAAVAMARKSGGSRIGMAVVVVLLGAYQIAHGLGAI